MHLCRAGLLLLAAIGLGCSEGGVAPVRIGDGVRVGTRDGRDPAEAYSNLHADFIAVCVRFKQMMYLVNPPNFPAAAGYARDLTVTLQKMHRLLKEPYATDLQPHVEWFARLAEECDRGNPTVTAGAFESRELAVRTGFSPSKVELVEQFPDAPAKTASDGRVQAPPPQPQPAKPADPPAWVFFTAWEKLHRDLETSWADGKDCAATFSRLLEALDLLAARLPKEKQVRLATYRDFYGTIEADTKGFSQVPKGGTRQDVSHSLSAVGANIRANCNPER